jgi:hypothetical protein
MYWSDHRSPITDHRSPRPGQQVVCRPVSAVLSVDIDEVTDGNSNDHVFDSVGGGGCGSSAAVSSGVADKVTGPHNQWAGVAGVSIGHAAGAPGNCSGDGSSPVQLLGLLAAGLGGTVAVVVCVA